jgi:hypothetical protein
VDELANVDNSRRSDGRRGTPVASLTAGKLLEMILSRRLPPETPIEIYNGSVEFYGIDTVDERQLQIIDDRVVISFAVPWTPDDLRQYRKDRSKL